MSSSTAQMPQLSTARGELESPLIEALKKLEFPSLPKAAHYLDFPLRSLSGFANLSEMAEKVVKGGSEASASFDSPESSTKVLLSGDTYKLQGSCSEGLEILSLEEASESYLPAMRARREQLAKDEKDYIALAASALSPEGVFIYADEGEHTVELLHLVDGDLCGDQLCAFLSKVEIFVASEAKLKLLYRMQSKNISKLNAATVASTIDCKLEDQAVFDLFIELEEMGPQCPRLLFIRGNCAAGSRLHCEDHSHSTSLCRNDYHIVLDGHGADAKVVGSRLIAGQDHFATNLLLEHRATECTSTQNIRALVQEKGRSSFSGKIFVHQLAQKTDAYQLSKALILSDEAVASHRPNLEIFADDVKASHGATTGTLDEEASFYLSSRGLCSKEARKLQVQGFIAENVPEPISLSEKMVQRVMQRIEKQVTDL